MLHLAPGQYWFDVVPLVMAIVLLPLISIYSGRQIAKNPSASLIPRYLQTGLRGWLMVALIAAIWWRTGRPFAALGLDTPVGRYGLYGLYFCALMVLVLILQHSFFERLMKPERVAKAHEKMAQVKILPRNMPELLVFFGVAITAGIWEELVYRGFLFWFLAPYMNLVGVIAIATVVFGVGHGYQGLRGVLTTGLIGLVFAIAFAFTRSLWWLMVVHALIDLNGGVSGYRLQRMPAPKSDDAMATAGNQTA